MNCDYGNQVANDNDLISQIRKPRKHIYQKRKNLRAPKKKKENTERKIDSEMTYRQDLKQNQPIIDTITNQQSNIKKKKSSSAF